VIKHFVRNCISRSQVSLLTSSPRTRVVLSYARPHNPRGNLDLKTIGEGEGELQACFFDECLIGLIISLLSIATM
jgi:hypothetical protein